MDDKDFEIIGYFLKNPDTTFSQMVYKVRGDLPDLSARVNRLVKAGILKPAGFAAHTECYKVIGGREFMSNAGLGKAFAEA